MPPEWISLANLALNLLLIPLLKILWDIKIDLARINGRINALERWSAGVDRRHELDDTRRANGQG